MNSMTAPSSESTQPPARQLRAALSAGPIIAGTFVELWGDYDHGPMVWINDAAINGGDPVTLEQAEAMLVELTRAVDAVRSLT